MRGFLGPYKPEPVTLMTLTTTQNDFGETTEEWTPTKTVEGNVQPLGAVEAEAAGLRRDTDSLRVQVTPVIAWGPGDVLGLRGGQYVIRKTEVWQSFAVALVEPV